VIVETTAPPPAETPVVVPSWPSETPLLAAVVLASLGLWLILALTIIGLVYALLIAAVLFFSHVLFVAHVRGSGVRLGPEQFPELWQRVVELACRAGLEAPPESYLMESGGALNAFATRLFRGRLVVLFTPLVEACGEDRAALDMVIGHELGHLRAGHLNLLALTAPGRLIPFLGAAYSRACELTSDRWGAALCGDRGAATRGLAILAAGGQLGPRVNLRSYVEQGRQLDTGWMTIGRWLSTYPPLSARVAAIEPALAPESLGTARGPLRALGILGLFVAVPTVLAGVAMVLWLTTMKGFLAAASAAGAETSTPALAREVDPRQATLRVESDFDAIAAVILAHHRRTGEWAADDEPLRAAWASERPGEEFPSDPFDGYAYALSVIPGGGVILVSSGPDAEAGTEDDLTREVLPEVGPSS
jgi:Zn-dependent protease with chaperone function